MTNPHVSDPDVTPSRLFLQLRKRVNALPDVNHEIEVEAITRASLKLDSSDEKTRLACLIFGQTGKSPYEMEVTTVLHLRSGGLLEKPAARTRKAVSLS